MIPQKLVQFDEEELDRIRAAALAGELSGASGAVEEYEEAVCDYFGSPYALACSSGTAAIYLALRAAGVGSGDEVLVSAVGAVMTALPVLELGARPVFVDVRDEDSFIVGVDDIRAAVSSRTRAVVTASMWGYPSLSLEVQRVCREYGLVLVDDAAQAHGSRTAEGPVGAVADTGCFSTHARKLVATGEGGFVLTRKPAIYERLHELRAFGLGPAGGEFGQRYGFNFKLSGLLAAAGTSQIQRLDGRIAARDAVARLWAKRFSCSESVQVVALPMVHNGYGFAIQSTSRREIEQVLAEEELVATDTSRYAYTVLYRYPVFHEFARRCPRAEALVDQLIVLPCHEGVQPTDIDHVASVIDAVASRAN